jgi:hypothetical protein
VIRAVHALDGNAIGGELLELFGVEMTAARGACRHCGAHRAIGELAVYLCAPGTVVRCPACGGVVIVLVHIGSGLQANLDAFQLIAPEV